MRRRIQSPRWFLQCSVLCVSLVFLTPSGQAQDHVGPYPQADIEYGSRIFAAQCSSCHGLSGDQVAGVNLRSGQFKRVFSDADLRTVITNGIQGTAMPPHNFNPPELAGIVAYIRNMGTFNAGSVTVGTTQQLDVFAVPANGALLIPATGVPQKIFTNAMTIAVTTSSYSTYTLSNIVTSAGTHVIDIAFANGYTGPFPGFALYIQSIQITPNADVPAPVPSPPTSVDAYHQQLLNLINGSRASAGLPSYTFSAVQSAGTAGCVGSYGHSVHMAQVGQISHDQFPQDICIPWSAAGENVGEASGSESVAIQTLHRLMMSEGPGGGHYQNIMSTTFTTVGIGLYYTGGTLWLTEDFVR